MKLGVITDGISRDLAHALSVMDEVGLEYAELQYVRESEVGDHDPGQRRRMKSLLQQHGHPVSCISRHLFAGMTMQSSLAGDTAHRQQMEALRRCIDQAHELACPNVRIMTGRKEQILWGSHGAEQWNVATGAWQAQLSLIAPAVDLARDAGITLVVETGNGTMVNSCWTAARLIDELEAHDVLKVLWDPANNCWAHERAMPDGYDALQGGYLGHLHIKDVQVDTPRATLETRPLGQGQLAEQFPFIAAALRSDRYDGVVSLESVYHPGDGNFESGFRQNIEMFKALFGNPA